MAAGALVLAVLLGAPADAQAAHWTEVPFPEGEIAQAVVQDSAGNVWAATLTEDGSYGHIEVLRSGASSWEDACQGLDWSLFQWNSGLTAVDDKVFLTTSDGSCYARSAADYEWHRVDSALQFTRLIEWNGYLWSGSDYLGTGRLDPQTEQSEYVLDGLLVVMDNPDAARAYRSPRGNDDFLYVGCTVSPEMAESSDFSGVTVYRLARGGITWEDTGLTVKPLEGDLQVRGTGAYTDWGVWNVVATNGYAFCQVMIPASGFNVRCYLYDEAAGDWDEVDMPDSDTGWFYLASGEPCFVRGGDFYFPTHFVNDGVVCDVLDPAARSWERDVKVEGISWTSLVNTAQFVGNELVVAYGEESFVEAVPLPTELSKDPGVIGTNVGLTLLLALVFGFTSTLFNNTLKDNHERVAKAFSPLAQGGRALGTALGPPLRRFGNWIRAFTFRSELVRRVSARLPEGAGRWLRPLAVVFLAALIYCFLDPTFGFSGHGASLFFSLAISAGLVTFAFEGTQALVSSRSYGIPAAVKLFPAAIAIAVFCVILSRATDFAPGYLYGFVGGMAFLGALQPDERRMGRLTLVGVICLLVVSMATWFLAIPIARAAAEGSGGAAFLESVCAAVFVAGLEGLFFGLIPLSVMDGGTLFRWNKVAWAVLFAVVVFLFWHVLLNKNSKYGAAFGEASTQVILVLLAFWTVAAVGFYLLFRGPKKAPYQPPPSPPPTQLLPPPPPPPPPSQPGTVGW